jgi:hypothetical protein
MKQEIDLDALQSILKISYPTALKMAREHGRLKPEAPRGRWLIPVATIRALLDSERQEVAGKESRLQAVVATNGNPT